MSELMCIAIDVNIVYGTDNLSSIQAVCTVQLVLN